MPSLGSPSGRRHGSGKLYWRSLDELADTPAFRAMVEREFPYLTDVLAASPSRRHFLKLMGASLALAGLTGCRWPQEKIVEYARRPPGRIPGEPQQFATAFERDGVATGYLITSYDGRPIKVEGNPSHPFSLGATDALAQAAILEIYDPDRSREPKSRVGRIAPAQAWDEFNAALEKTVAGLKAGKGEGLAILAQPTSSPTLLSEKARLLEALPKAQWFEYSPLSRDNERIGLTLALEKPHRAHLNLTEARVILSFDSDFLMTHPAALRYTREFARSRTAFDWEKKSPVFEMPRLYVVESNLSLTGSNADERYAERSSDIAIRLCQLGAELGKQGLKLPGAAGEALRTFDAGEKQASYLSEIAKDLLAHRGRSAITVGPRQPAEAHAIAALLNAALENAGKTVTYFEEPATQRASHFDAIAALAEQLKSGKVKTLVILGGNPAYDAPADVGFANALKEFKGESIHLSLYHDETSRLCSRHVPMAHDLEAWGDGRAWDGTLSVAQPLIDPLYGDGKDRVPFSPMELVARLSGQELAKGYELVRRTFKEKFAAKGSEFEAAWRTALHDGVVAKTAWEGKSPTLAGDWGKICGELKNRWKPAEKDKFEVVFAQDHKVYDGRYVNNAWLQELPDPITKLTWDNAALISPQDADRLRLRGDDLIEITLGSAKLRIPVYVVPGHAPGSITLPLGYGREVAGKVAEGSGFDVNVIRSRAAFYIGAGATIHDVGDDYKLATTQDHHSVDTNIGNKETQRRVPELVRAGTLEDYRRDQRFVKEGVHELPLVQMFHDYDSHFQQTNRWAMGIDLSRCTGCSACVVACQAENNIPVVGKHEVRLGREMHWLRIDRYFEGAPENPRVVHQPLPCQQCENAPCEQVCPVAATIHDEQGLNVMVYNRCVGTRYCSNNCPYKVRRFNWFYNHHGPRHPRSREGGKNLFQTFDIKNTSNMLSETPLTDIEKMANNPDVTVRSRGVMEKCTFCVQRISRAKIAARNSQVQPRIGDSTSGEIPDGTVVPACAQACPAEAIMFGDLNWNRYFDEADKKWKFRRDEAGNEVHSRVYDWHAHERSYVLLEEINTRPRAKYLAKLRNTLLEKTGSEGGKKGHGAEHA